jgi:hypothetical protein
MIILDSGTTQAPSSRSVAVMVEEHDKYTLTGLTLINSDHCDGENTCRTVVTYHTSNYRCVSE